MSAPSGTAAAGLGTVAIGDDLARASRRHRLDVPLRLPPILGSAPRRSQPSSQCPKTSAPIVARVTATASARDGKAVAIAKKAVPLRGEAPGAKARQCPPRQCPPSPVSSLVSVVSEDWRGRGARNDRTLGPEQCTCMHLRYGATASPRRAPFRNPGGLRREGGAASPPRGWPRGQKAQDLRSHRLVRWGRGGARSACIFAAMHHGIVGGAMATRR